MQYVCAIQNIDKRLPMKDRVKIESYEERLEELKEELEDGDEFAQEGFAELKAKMKEFVEYAKEEDLYIFELEIELEDMVEELERKIPSFRIVEAIEL